MCIRDRPYVEGVYLAFDHHASEVERVKGKPDNHVIDPKAPSAARVVYDYFGGAERFVERAVEALIRSDLSLTIVARRWRGAPTHQVLRCDPFYLGRTWRDASFARCVQKLIADQRFDIVQSHERIAGCDVFRAGDGIHATWLELRSRAGGSLSRLGQALSPWHRYTLAAEAAMFADPRLRAVICNSRMVRDDLARRFGLDPAKLHVIYNGIDLDDYSPALRDAHRSRVRQEQGVGETATVMLFVGSGFERKGVRALIDAAAMMRESGARLWIIGKDKHRARYEAPAKAAGGAGRVRRARDRPALGALVRVLQPRTRQAEDPLLGLSLIHISEPTRPY